MNVTTSEDLSVTYAKEYIQFNAPIISRNSS